MEKLVTDWEELKFWGSGEWQVIQERLDVFDATNISYNPKREDLFRALDLVSPDRTRVLIVGQDPYPDPEIATGVAFSIPCSVGKRKKPFPPTLENLLKEYSDDLGVPFPNNGNLEKWCKQGVLLWNAYPCVYSGIPGSMNDWVEWEELTKEIVNTLNRPDVVQVFLGAKARKFAPGPINQYNPFGRLDCVVLEYSHPSPLGARRGRNPFLGSRMFSTINSYLKPTIDWSL